MSSKYTHCYSNYVNHILNSSPTKVTYTFSKGQRFTSPNKQKKAPIDQVLEKVYTSSNRKNINQFRAQNNIFSKTPRKINNKSLDGEKQNSLSYKKVADYVAHNQKDRSKSFKRSNSSVQKYSHKKPKSPTKNQGYSHSKSATKLNKHGGQHTKKRQNEAQMKLSQNIKYASDNKRKKLNRKQQSPIKKYQLQHSPSKYNKIRYQEQQDQFGHLSQRHESNKYLKYSPYYRRYLQKDKEENQISGDRGKSNNKLRRSKSSKNIENRTTTLEEAIHLYQNITSDGYYPVGKEISPDGKYLLSTYKNVTSHSFGLPQQESSRKNNVKNHNQPQGEIKRDGVIFTRSKRNQNSPIRDNYGRMLNPNNYYPSNQTPYHHNHFTDKKKDKKQTYEKYVPFSQFGVYVNGFKN